MEEKTYKKNIIKVKPFSLTERVIKRFFDILSSLIGSFFTLILMIILFIPYHICPAKDRGPMFFKQERYGRNGKMFYIYKFRTMKIDSISALESDPSLFQKYVDNNYKLSIEEDPRITKLGKFLRKTSIDEFPQFFNVIKGELSLVGPRPIVKEEIKEYEGLEDYFFMMKPGITGIWTSSGRSSLGYPERVYVELSYLSEHSFLFDLKILFRTFIKVLAEEGTM